MRNNYQSLSKIIYGVKDDIASVLSKQDYVCQIYCMDLLKGLSDGVRLNETS